MRSECLGERVATRLTSWIRQGKWHPGDRLPAERQLALELGVSRPSLNNALSILVQSGLIDKVRGSGNFIRKQNFRLALVFPEKEFLVNPLPSDHGFSIMELQRGIFSEAAQRGIQIVMLYIPEPKTDEEHRKALRQLQEFDASLFYSTQLRKLRLELAQSRPVICHSSNYDHPEDWAVCSCIAPDNPATCEQMAEYIRKTGRREVILVGPLQYDYNLDFLKRFDAILKSHGLRTEIQSETIPPSQLLKRFPDAVFFLLYPRLTAQYYQAARDLKREPGKDFILLLRGSGMTLQNLIPQPVFARVDYFHFGEEMVKTACRLIDHPDHPPEHLFFPSELILPEPEEDRRISLQSTLTY